jgi:DNA replication protein DnaC
MNSSTIELPTLIRRGVPARTARAAIRAPFDTDASRSAVAARERLVVLSGHVGIGKSVAAALWLLSKAQGKPECMRWIQSGDLSRGYSYDADAFDAITGVWALVVDDFGVEYIDEKGRYTTTLEEILSKRFARMRLTLLTTNVTDPIEFSQRYGERLASRIHEDGAFIVCGGDDLRRTETTNLRRR